MKKKSFKNLRLGKKLITNLNSQKGGKAHLPMQSACGDASCGLTTCISFERDCNSEGPVCDCGTSGNC